MLPVFGKLGRISALGVAILVGLTSLGYASGGDLRINIPKRTKPTPVQQYNRDGVAAVKKHNYEKAKKLFYKAYLLDPDDPFTLNNLGYVAELEGDVDSAQRFYDLAAAQNSAATVDKASNDAALTKPVSQVAGHSDTKTVMVNRYNVNAIGLLVKDRTGEAETILSKALALDPRNPFTLNNLGYVKEQEGELEQAIKYYQQAANLHSTEPVVVTINKNWRGKPISQIAEENANKVEQTLAKSKSTEQQVARLNLQGVSALNRNDAIEAKKDFEKAYKLAPDDAFTLNNMGYVSEMIGDKESADFYYEKAGQAPHAGDRVTIASHVEAEGQKLHEVSDTNGNAVDARMQAELELKRTQQKKEPAILHRRDNSVFVPQAPAPEKEQPEEKQNPAEQPNQLNRNPDSQTPDGNPGQDQSKPNSPK